MLRGAGGSTPRPAHLDSAALPTFCRHNRFADRCPICRADVPTARRTPPRGATASPRSGAATRSRSGAGLQIRREERAAEDGYASPLVPGLRASADAERFADEIAFACARLDELSASPPGLYEDVATARDRERATWLAFVIAYAGTIEDGEDPFASVRESGLAATTGPSDPAVSSALAALVGGPRGSHDPAAPLRTIDAYRTWTERAGGTSTAFAGEPGWTAQRRFERTYERLALAGLTRASRFDLLVTLGRLGVYELEAARLEFGGDDRVTLAAKRVFGIGDSITLERRAAALAADAAVPLGALDLALHNWAGPSRARGGVAPGLEPDEAVRALVAQAIGL